MKILYVVHSFPPWHWRGTEVYALELATAMARRHDVHIFHLRHDPEAQGVILSEATFRGLPVHAAILRVAPETPETYFWDPQLEARFRELVNSLDPQVVHFLYYTGGLSLNLPAIARDLGKKVFITVTDFSGFCPRGQLLDRDGQPCPGPREGLRCVHCLFDRPLQSRSEELDRLLREYAPPGLISNRGRPELAMVRRRLTSVFRAFRVAERLIYPNGNAQQRYHEAGLWARQEMIMDYGIDLAPFAEHRKAAAAKVRIAFVGQLLPHKGLHVLAAAARDLPGDWQLLIYGSRDDPGAREYYDRLQLDPARAEFKGTFPFEDMNAVLEGIDILVVPSQWDENCPLIVKYALATGTWAVLSDQPGMVAERAGLPRARFFRPRDPEDLRKVLIETMKEFNRAFATDVARTGVIDIQAQAKELERLYRK